MAKTEVTLEECRTLDEAGLRDAELPWPNTEEELIEQIDALVNREHDYGTCVYAMSLAAFAAFRYVSHKLGVSGFQASCADLDFLSRSRRLEHGFRIVGYENLLYPQYEEAFDELDFWTLIRANIKRLSEEAGKLLEKTEPTHPEVRAHWEKLVEMGKEEVKEGG